MPEIFGDEVAWNLDSFQINSSIFTYFVKITTNSKFTFRVKVWRWISVRKILTAYFLNLFAVNLREIYIFNALSVFLQKKRKFLTRARTSYLLHAFTFLFNCHVLLFYFLRILFRFSKRWKANAMIFCKRCGEFRVEFLQEMWWNTAIFFHRIHNISYIILPQKSMRWIFVRNAMKIAVNFCMKCGEMRWFLSPHSPHSPHFEQNFTQKPRPGMAVFILYSSLNTNRLPRNLVNLQDLEFFNQKSIRFLSWIISCSHDQIFFRTGLAFWAFIRNSCLFQGSPPMHYSTLNAPLVSSCFVAPRLQDLEPPRLYVWLLKLRSIG